MAVISVNITTSIEEIVSGVPRFVSLSANIPCSIFYTLDGSDPTILSTIYTAPIFLPTNTITVILKVLATNGTDFSPIIEEIYQPNILNNTRLPHSATNLPEGMVIPNLYPFGTAPSQPNGIYLNPGKAGINVDDPTLPQISDGYDGFGNENNFTNEPFNVENYEIKYSTTNAEGARGRGIGTLPANVKITLPTAPPEESEMWSNTFDPRAQVIFQDYSKENPNDPPNINKQFFTAIDPQKAQDGVSFFNQGLDAPTTTGSFVRSSYNPRTNEMTYYYFDSQALKWIISKQPYTPGPNAWDGNMSQFLSSRHQGVGLVLEWIPGMRRVLF